MSMDQYTNEYGKTIEMKRGWIKDWFYPNHLEQAFSLELIYS